MTYDNSDLDSFTDDMQLALTNAGLTEAEQEAEIETRRRKLKARGLKRDMKAIAI